MGPVRVLTKVALVMWSYVYRHNATMPSSRLGPKVTLGNTERAMVCTDLRVATRSFPIALADARLCATSRNVGEQPFMPCTIAWLDSSREEQRRMREVINLFTQTESRDELGIGQVRDSFSDRLFPGTSTLHTRARYLLLIPWCFRSAARLATSGEDLERRASENERRLIVALNKCGAHEGLIGRNVLTKLKTLPSALYWSALVQWGVLIGDVEDELAARTWRYETDELVERAPTMWNILPAPDGFPDSADTLDLSFEEAGWVRDRMLSGSPGSLLEVLLRGDDPGRLQLPHAWDVAVEDAELADLMQHARLFSSIVRGAALSYNLAVAHRYQELGLSQVEEPVARYIAEIADWAEELDSERAALQAWDLENMWSGALAHNPRIGWATRVFVDEFVDLLRNGRRPDDPKTLAVVTAREKRQKGTQSRLVNDKLLRTWTGASGTGRLTYRWANVTRLLTDVSEGLQRAPA